MLVENMVAGVLFHQSSCVCIVWELFLVKKKNGERWDYLLNNWPLFKMNILAFWGFSF